MIMKMLTMTTMISGEGGDGFGCGVIGDEAVTGEYQHRWNRTSKVICNEMRDYLPAMGLAVHAQTCSQLLHCSKEHRLQLLSQG